jgi:hypothetical protein
MSLVDGVVSSVTPGGEADKHGLVAGLMVACINDRWNYSERQFFTEHLAQLPAGGELS